MAKLNLVSLNSSLNSSIARSSHRCPTWAFAAMWYNSTNNGGSDYYIGTEPPEKFLSSRWKMKGGASAKENKRRKMDSSFWYYPDFHHSFYGKRFPSKEQAEQWLAHQKKVSRDSWAAFLAD